MRDQEGTRANAQMKPSDARAHSRCAFELLARPPGDQRINPRLAADREVAEVAVDLLSAFSRTAQVLNTTTSGCAPSATGA
jgi:hypothetical protein